MYDVINNGIRELYFHLHKWFLNSELLPVQTLFINFSSDTLNPLFSDINNSLNGQIFSTVRYINQFEEDDTIRK